ncbi:hypothetical protein Tco_0000164, partial [Tanacetum coccineum]
DDDNIEDDEQVAKAIQVHEVKQLFAIAEIGHGIFLNYMGGLWHPECFRCHILPNGIINGGELAEGTLLRTVSF